ncbi:MAG TPA: preprotein translocase subunit SecG, partial [Flavobacteriales bacterium]|nr:preprotein translocase subunit SecG [Flavobacteriales bacterium]
MFTLITVLIFIDCILLTIIVLLQESKGGGLASGFSSANQLMGVRRTGDWLEKATWTLAIALLVLSLSAAAVQGTGDVVEESSSEGKELVGG